MAALATLVALLGAMFVWQSPAQAALGDIMGGTSGVCLVDVGTSTTADIGLTVDDGQTALRYVVGPAGTTTDAAELLTVDNGGDTANPVVACEEAQLGWDVAVAANGTTAPTVTIKEPSVSIKIAGESDAIVTPGSAVNIEISVLNFKDQQVARTGIVLDWVTVSGVLAASGNQANLALTGDSANPFDADSPFTDGDMKATRRIVIPAGTTPGDYTIQARVIWDGFEDADSDGSDDNSTADTLGSDESARVDTTLTVGDAGAKNLSTASLAYGLVEVDDPATSASEEQVSTGSAVAKGGAIYLTVKAENSLGNPANSSGLTSLSVLGFGATLELFAPSATAARGDSVQAAMANIVTDNDAAQVTQTVIIKVTKTDSKPGTVEVQARMTGTDGVADTEKLTLTFTGDASSLALAAPSGTLHNQSTGADDNRDVISLGVSATDAGGNDSSVPIATFTIMGPDEMPVPTSRIDWERGSVGSKQNAKVTLTSLVAAPSRLAAGEYTITAKRGSVSAEQKFFVVGPADTIEASADSDDLEVGQIVKVTAEVRDEAGNAVSNGTSVTFTPAGSATLVAVGAILDENSNAAIVPSKDGMASARFYVSKGSGVTSIIVTADDVADDVVTFNIAGDEPEAMPEEEASVGCLSELSGFATWSCGVDSSASEIFGLVEGRGATAIHLWNGTAWVRYSVVDSTMVPGSSDFMVTENDILYISN